MPTSRRSPAASAGASPCAGCCCKSPTCCCSTSRPTTSTPKSVAWLERHLAGISRHRRRRHARPLLPRQRRRVDPRARPRPRHSVEGQLLVLAGAEAAAAGASKRSKSRAPAEDAASASWSGCAWRRAPRRQEQGPPQRLREAAARSGSRTIETVEIQIPPGPHLGDLVVEAEERQRRATATTLLIEDLDFRLPRGGIVGVIGPNGAGKTTLFRMIVGQEKPDGGNAAASATRSCSATSIRTATPSIADKTVFEEITGGADDLELGKRKVAVARLRRRGSTSRAGPAAEGRRAVRRRAQPRPPGQAAAPRRQPAAARRADQRPRRRHAAGAGRSAGQLRRLRRGHQPRPLVPRPHRHAHPRLRGRQQDRLVRGQLSGLRRERKQRLGAEADQPHRIKYRKLTR